MNPINHHTPTSPPPWKKVATLTLPLLLWHLNTPAATDCNAVTQISKVECESLLELYHSTNGAQWWNNEGWNVTNTPCSWFGVTCENGVTGISLLINGLTGTIPDFSALPNLQVLVLLHNQLTGTIPDFSALPNLQELYLGNNQLTGTIPDFSALPNLQRLELDNNQLTGTIPNFSALPNLEVSFSGNQLTLMDTICNIVTEISTIECESLLELYHSTNGAEWRYNKGWNVTNTPCSWYGVTCENGGVTVISLGGFLNNNNLNGTLPNFKGLPNLQFLQLSNNQLTGTIPNFSALPNLRVLYLNNNQLTGTIPDFSTLPNLQWLYLNNNQLTGAIPDFSVLPNLGVLSLDNNQLTGAIPDFSALTELKILGLQNNTICKDPNINYAIWQEELDSFPNCPANPPPTPIFTISPPQGMAPLEIELDASGSEGAISQYAWTVNGQTLSGQTSAITLTEAGEYPIVLSVTGNDGQIAISQQSVFVWQPGQAIIVNGTLADDYLYKYSHEFTQRMYGLLKQRGYDDDKVHYLDISPPDIEAPLGFPESERQDYNLFDPEQELSQAFAQATAKLKASDQLVFYFHGHASVNRAYLLNDELSATQLRDLFATVPAGVQQIIILDTCYAGSFLDELAGVAHRVVVTSTDDKSLTWQISESSFAGKFMQSLEYGMSLLESFREAETMILNDRDLFAGQRPWLDDDHDGQFRHDGLRATNIYLGTRKVSQAPAPRLQVHPYLSLSEGESAPTLWVRTTPSGTDSIHQVRAILVQPDYQVREYQGKGTDFTRIELNLVYNPAQDRYETVYDGFCAQAGLWQIQYQAQDVTGVWSEIVPGEVQVTNCLPVSTKMLLNQSRYTAGNLLQLKMEVNGNATVDLYVAIIFPDGTFFTIVYPFPNMSEQNAIQVYQPNVEIAGQKNYPIMDFSLPGGIPTGQYQVYGVLVTAEADPNDSNNWIHFDQEEFEVY